MKKSNRIIPITVLFLLLIMVVGCLVTQNSQQQPSTPMVQSTPKPEKSTQSSALDYSADYEIPASNRKLLVQHTAYTLLYNEDREQADWVAYKLLKSNLASGKAERSNQFITDPMVKSGSATNADYAKSGYDRGHLAPAADMQQSELTMKESFYYSNMSPQKPEFNRGIWKKLEEKVRDWAMNYDTLYVVTGPVFISTITEIGPDKVDVPSHYFKALMTIKTGKVFTTGFLLPNKGSNEPLVKYEITIDSLEKVTGIDFYYQLPDAIENSTECVIGAVFK